MIRSVKQTGYILLPVIVVITVVAAIALLMNTESALESNTAGSELDAQQAQYVAEAGLNHALWLAQQQGCGPYSNLTDEPLDNDKYTSNLTTDLGSTTSYSSTVDQDTWITSNQPDDNKGSDGVLHVGFNSGDSERPLLRFDLSSIPVKAAILSATAWFYVDQSHPEGAVDIHRITADWIETDATWNTMNANMDSAVITSIPPQPTSDVWVAVNLTSQVQAWINDQPNYGITLNSTSEGVDGRYDSRESANAPYLEVIVGTPPTSPALLKAVGMLANGVTRDITRNDVVLYQHPPGMLQLQPGAADGEDAEIWDQAPNNNYGAADETWVSSAVSDTTRSLLRFNLGAIPAGARIMRADLSLERESGSGADQPVSAHRIVNPWSEASVTWNQRESGTNWDTAGADFDNMAITTTPVGPVNQRYAWNITSLVQGWVDGSYPNYGVALVAAIAGMPGERFYTSDETDETRRPRLMINYTCACDEICARPQGGGNLLMVVINPTTLVAEDQKAKDLFESWGYTVSVISESANQSTYDSLIALNDVVFISETVNSNSVGTKLVNAPIGVVSQDGDYNPDLGLAPGASLKIGGDIDIVSTDHYITQPFAVGTHRIYTADMEQAIVSGSLTADQQTLAENAGDGSLVVLDRGDAMEGGGTAAGRRVILPLGTRYRFDWDYLNANGRLLVQRALAWGMSKDKFSKGNVLLVVPDPASLNSRDSSKQALIESWGYTVNLIDDSDSQANIDAAAAANDVIYVSGSISGGALADKLTGSPTPIVNEFNGKLDNFGFSSSTGNTVSADTFTSTNAAHYISETFAGAATTVFSSSLTMPVPGGTLAPDLETVGETAGAVAALVTLDTGAQRWDGNPAPARRVHLPFGSAETSQLTADGENLMRRALEWAGGAGCVDMQPLLLVVGDAATLSSKDDGMKTLIRSWCYSVTVIDDGDSQANFDAAAAAVDVVYVSGTTSGPSLQDKLTGSPTPIVNEINGKLDNFGFSSSTASSVSASAFSATDASHYISEPFTGNPVTVFTTDLAMPVPGGTLAPDLQIVGETTGAIPALVTLDTGAQRWDGNPAPARRVHLPFTNAEPSQLTADGEILMRRSIEWAGSPLPGPIAHWKLDDAVGMTAIDSVGGNDATLNGNPAWTTGVADGALEFDGSGDYATTDNPFTPPPVGTVSFWMKVPGSPASHGRILGLDDTWEIRHVTTGTPDGIAYGLVFDLGVTGVNTEFVTTVTVDTPDQWYFVAATYDTNTDAYQVYLDGVLHKSGTYPSALAVPAANPLSLGTRTGSSNYFTGTLDDVQIYDRILSAGEIAEFYSAGAPAVAAYTELYEPWTAATPDNWETVSLVTFGVPANAVVEVAVINEATSAQRWGGVRAVGSTLDRRLQLQEAEAGGIDVVTMHVQADVSSQIEHYSDNTSQISFILLGYWTGAVYVELMDPFTANASNSWVEESLADDGLGPNQVAEIAIVNTNTGAERLAGVRPSGATYQRRFMLHEAESGGVDALSMMVTTDASSIAEVFASSSADVDFYVLGYWDTSPGTYTATGGAHGQVSSPMSWETIDLSSYGVPVDSVAQFVLANENQGTENSMRVREVGSTINNRALLLHEAEAGGSDLGSLHANVDASQQVQWAAAQGPAGGFFYPVGWWVLSP
ncbi:MAG: DNRLRE domain-containing protein [Gammaproteobacteria bacterium]|nr:DNRLRE domain-containing protein [Gammaproteobacteria bacterium]